MLKSLRTKLARLRYAKNDPLRYQHVLEADRLNYDEPIQADENVIDLDWYRAHPDGVPVDES